VVKDAGTNIVSPYGRAFCYVNVLRHETRKATPVSHFSYLQSCVNAGSSSYPWQAVHAMVVDMRVALRLLIAGREILSGGDGHEHG